MLTQEQNEIKVAILKMLLPTVWGGEIILKNTIDGNRYGQRALSSVCIMLPNLEKWAFTEMLVFWHTEKVYNKTPLRVYVHTNIYEKYF